MVTDHSIMVLIGFGMTWDFGFGSSANLKLSE